MPISRVEILGYPQPGKERSRVVLAAFLEGCGGRFAAGIDRLESGGAAFYGIRNGIAPLIEAVRKEEREYYVGDNAFFDQTRGKYFRFARSALQFSGLARPDHERLKALGVEVHPWRAGGGHVVVVEQSREFYELAGADGGWLARTTEELRRHTDRPLRERRWSRDKGKAQASLAEDLAGAWALVTHASAAAVMALVAGVPVFVTGQSAAAPMASGPLDKIESPSMPDGREDWAAGLATMQWTLDELRIGMAYRTLRGAA